MSYANDIGNLKQALSPIVPTNQVVPANTSSDTKAAHDVAVTNSNSADETSLSSAGGLISQALEVSDVRFDKVTGLQKAIAVGTYSIPALDVAGKIIQSLLD